MSELAFDSFMNLKKQLRLKVGDLVVVFGEDKPKKVTCIEGADYTGRLPVSLDGLWHHETPIIRRYPRVGEQVVIVGNSDGNTCGRHHHGIGDVGAVIFVESGYVTVEVDGAAQTVFEKDVLLIRKQKESKAEAKS